MFSRCSQDVCRIIPGWSFQMKVWTLMIQRNSMIPNYSMIPAIQWSPTIWWSPAIRWSIRSMDFDKSKVYGDTYITDGLVLLLKTSILCRDYGVYLFNKHNIFLNAFIIIMVFFSWDFKVQKFGLLYWTKPTAQYMTTNSVMTIGMMM